MPSVNKVILIGNLTREPEIRQTNGGGMVSSFTLAMNRRYTNARQELVEETCFVDVSAFQRNAEIIQQFVHKGDPIYIEGRLKYDTWVDKTTGVNRNRLTVVCENLQLLARRSDGQGAMGGAPAQNAGAYQPAGTYRQASPRPAYGAPQQQGGYAAPAARPQYGQPQATGYGQPVDVPAPQQYRSASPMPSFQAPEPPQDVPQDDAPVDDTPF